MYRNCFQLQFLIFVCLLSFSIKTKSQSLDFGIQLYAQEYFDGYGPHTTGPRPVFNIPTSAHFNFIFPDSTWAIKAEFSAISKYFPAWGAPNPDSGAITDRHGYLISVNGTKQIKLVKKNMLHTSLVFGLSRRLGSQRVFIGKDIFGFSKRYRSQSVKGNAINLGSEVVVFRFNPIVIGANAQMHYLFMTQGRNNLSRWFVTGRVFVAYRFNLKKE